MKEKMILFFQVTFGTERPDRKFDIVLDNDTSIHLQGFLVHKSSDFALVNDGEHPLRVNGEWLNSNEMCALGSRAIIQVSFLRFSIEIRNRRISFRFSMKSWHFNYSIVRDKFSFHCHH